MDLLNGMLQKDQDEFRRICNKLINVCFICRQNQATKSDYYFIQKYKEKFEELLGVLGYRLEMNEEYGVALRLFRRYQLIELLDSDLKNEESRVLIYNSILMAVRVEDIKSVYEKVDSYRKGKLKDEEADQTETD